MKRFLIIAGLAAFLYLPCSLAAQNTYDHGEVEAYGDLFRINSVNYLGLGGQVSFNIARYAALEASMNYDFEKNYTNITVSGSSGTGTSTTYTAGVRPITALFGPKFQFGSSGSLRAFLEAKAGFVDFTTTCNAPAGSGSCFTSSLSNFGGSSTHLAVFPGGGIEAFAGPFGFRIDAGDEMWVNNGEYNNLRVTFGPAFRF